jgi:gluconate kinase
MLIILFGLSGSGKNFVAEILASHFHFHFFDADSVLPQEMRVCIQQKKMFTQAMRDHFTDIIKKNIAELKTTDNSTNLVVTQALYKEKNRREILEAYPDAKFIYVQADLEKILVRLQKSHHNIDADYAKKISVNFQDPKLPHKIIINNTNKEDVISQLQVFLQDFYKNTASAEHPARRY